MKIVRVVRESVFFEGGIRKKKENSILKNVSDFCNISNTKKRKKNSNTQKEQSKSLNDSMNSQQQHQ
jgi:hypothetical protein